MKGKEDNKKRKPFFKYCAKCGKRFDPEGRFSKFCKKCRNKARTHELKPDRISKKGEIILDKEVIGYISKQNNELWGQIKYGYKLNAKEFILVGELLKKHGKRK